MRQPSLALLSLAIAIGAGCPRAEVTDTDAPADTDPPAAEPLIEGGPYVVVSQETTDNTCGEPRFTAGPLTIRWATATSLEWDDLNGTLVTCAVDALGSATCDTFEETTPYVAGTELTLVVASEIEATSTTSFDLVQRITIASCEGINCDVVEYWLAPFPCSLAVRAGYTPAPPPSDEVAVTLYLTGADGAPLTEAAVQMNGAPGTPDASGATTFLTAPNTPVALESTLEGYLSLSITGWSGSAGGGFSRSLWTHAELDALVAALGATYDPSKGVVLARAVRYDAVGSYPFGGVTFGIDLPYDLAIVPDITEPLYYAVGDTTIEGQSPNVIFLNVTPGTTHLEYTTPDGYTCLTSFEGPDPEEPDLVVAPGTMTSISMFCSQI